MDRQFIVDEITAAMRAHDKPRLGILRLVKNEIDQKEKESRAEATPEDVVALVKKVLKQTGETLEGSIKVGTNAERTALLQEQVDLLTAYLPAQVGGDELRQIAERVIAEQGITEKRQMGAAIAAVASACGGNCDKAEVAKIVGGLL